MTFLPRKMQRFIFLVILVLGTSAYKVGDLKSKYTVLEISEGCSHLNVYVSTEVRDPKILAEVAHDVIVANKRKQFVSSHFVIFRDGNENFAWGFVDDVKPDKSFTCAVHMGYTPYLHKMDKSLRYLRELHPDYETKEWYQNGLQLMSLVIDPAGQEYLNVDGHERVRLFKLTRNGNEYSFEQPAVNHGNPRGSETIILRRNRFQDLQFIVKGNECGFGYSNLMHRVR